MLDGIEGVGVTPANVLPPTKELEEQIDWLIDKYGRAQDNGNDIILNSPYDKNTPVIEDKSPSPIKMEPDDIFERVRALMKRAIYGDVIICFPNTPVTDNSPSWLEELSSVIKNNVEEPEVRPMSQKPEESGQPFESFGWFAR